jgi:hypothetical protein
VRSVRDGTGSAHRRFVLHGLSLCPLSRPENISKNSHERREVSKFVKTKLPNTKTRIYTKARLRLACGYEIIF